jgi:hypothetical protein
LAAYVPRGLAAVRDNEHSSSADQRSFLGLAIDIQDGDALTDGNRHPLLPAILAPFAEREWAFYTTAKLFSLGLGVLTLVLLFLLARRLAGDAAGVVVALLVSRNRVFSLVTSHVVAESLLVPLFALSWYLTVRGLGCASSDTKRRGRLWLAAGAVAGLAYLTKATGQLIIMAFAVVCVLTYGRGLLRVWRDALRYVVGYSAVSCPLWIYNVIEHGSPLYNYNTAHAMWLDGWETKYARQALPTWLSYLRTHSLTQIAAREWQGLSRVLPIWHEAIVTDVGGAALGAIILLLVLASLLEHAGAGPSWREQRRGLLFSGALIGVHYVLFAWYAQVYVAARFFLPLTPALYVYGAGAVVAAGRLLAPRFRPTTGLRGALTALCALLCLGLGAGTVLGAADDLRTVRVNPYAIDRGQNADSEALLGWIQDNLAADAGPEADTIDLLFGPSTTLGTWKYQTRFDFDEIPSDMSVCPDLQAHIRQKHIDYALLDAQAVQRRPALLSPYLAAQGDAVTMIATPPGWALARVAPADESRWLVFQFLDRQPIGHALYLTLGGGIRLLGYDLMQKEAQPGGLVRFTLYWQSVAPVGEDYTVFTHLVGPDGAILAQQDGPPLEGRAPTSGWSAGSIYADHYVLSVPEGAAHGEARLEAGMYLLRTMERLSMKASDGQHVADDGALLLTQIVITEASQ